MHFDKTAAIAEGKQEMLQAAKFSVSL